MVARMRDKHVKCHEVVLRYHSGDVHHFAANLFRKPCTEFHENRPSFIGDITEKHPGLFFPGHSSTEMCFKI